jgi:hypothetical protein
MVGESFQLLPVVRLRPSLLSILRHLSASRHPTQPRSSWPVPPGFSGIAFSGARALPPRRDQAHTPGLRGDRLYGLMCLKIDAGELIAKNIRLRWNACSLAPRLNKVSITGSPLHCCSMARSAIASMVNCLSIHRCHPRLIPQQPCIIRLIWVWWAKTFGISSR